MLYCLVRHYELLLRFVSLHILALGLSIVSEPDVACLKNI
jgi:hypothetical protein